MRDITTLSAANLQALYDKRLAKSSAAGKACIAAGYGEVRHLEMRKLAEAGVPVAVAYIAASDAFQEVTQEQASRMRWHGSLRPIKRRA